MEQILNFIGKDSGFGEKNNSAYVEYDNKLLIIDCGFTVFSEIKNKFDFKKYDEIEVLITHLHNDHAGSLGQLILFLWYVFNKKTIIYTKAKRIKEFLEITGTEEQMYEIKEESENIKIIPTKHVIQLDSYGAQIKIFGKTITYTGDTSDLMAFDESISQSDELYVDVSKNGGVHLKFDEILTKLEKIKESGCKVILMHLDDRKYIEEKNAGRFII